MTDRYVSLFRDEPTTLGLVGQPMVRLDRPCVCGGRLVAPDIADLILEAVRFHNGDERHQAWRRRREREA